MKHVPLDLFDEETRTFFWAHVDRRGPLECWEWVGTHWYGSFFHRGHNLRAHRIAWALEHGCQVPEGMVLRHLCNNKPCCNPAHLKPGTQSDNMRDFNLKRLNGRRRMLGLPDIPVGGTLSDPSPAPKRRRRSQEGAKP